MKKIVFALVVVLIIGAFFMFQESDPMLQQNVEALSNDNGRIVDVENVDVQAFIEQNLYDKSPDYWGQEIENIKDFDLLKFKYSTEGTKSGAYMIKPKKEGNYPVFIFARSTNESDEQKEPGMLWLTSFASEEYILISPHYNINTTLVNNDKYIVEDTQSFLDLFPLIKSLPYADENNIFMLGNSKGGVLTYQAIKEDIEGVNIKAAAVTGAPTDLIQYYNDSIWGTQEAIKEKIGTPEENREAFVSKSPYYWPEKIDVPLLIQHGEKDKEIEVEHAVKLNEKLKNIEVDHELVTFPNGSHLLQKDSDIYLESTRNSYDWFGKYVDIENPF